MGNLPREAKKYQKYWILFLWPHKEKISPKSRCTREEMAELQLPREALCLALTDLRNTCTCFTFLYFFFHSLRIICFAWSFIFNVVQTSFFLAG